MNLLAAYGVAGGMPPARLESLRVSADGRARAVVGNGAPPNDEAGSYDTLLSEEQMSALRALCEDPELPATTVELGTVRADSGRAALELRGPAAVTDVTWSPFAERPPWLERAEAHLRDLLAAVREHPHATLRLAVESATEGGLTLVATNIGRAPLRTSLFIEGWAVPQLGGRPLELLDPPVYDDLEPGAQLRVTARAAEPARVSELVTVTATLELPGDDGPFVIEAYLQAPVS